MVGDMSLMSLLLLLILSSTLRPLSNGCSETMAVLLNTESESESASFEVLVL